MIRNAMQQLLFVCFNTIRLNLQSRAPLGLWLRRTNCWSRYL